MEGVWKVSNDKFETVLEKVETVWTNKRTIVRKSQDDTTTYVTEIDETFGSSPKRRKRRLFLSLALCIVIFGLALGTAIYANKNDEADTASVSSATSSTSSGAIPSPQTIPGPAPAPLPTLVPSFVLSERPSELPSMTPTEYVTQVTTFYAIGDVPYSEEEAEDLEDQMRKIPDNAEFLIHVGDIRNAEDSNECTRDEYESVAEMLRLSHAPVFIVMGDNEWNDCPNMQEGWDLWQEIFVEFDSKHWDHDFDVRRQPGRPENFSFVHKDALFIGLNLVGKPVIDEDEWAERLDDEYKWSKYLIRQYRDDMGERTGRVTIFGHADPKPEHNDFFEPLKDFVEEELDNRIPILYLNGNKHEWSYEPDFMGQSSFLRITLTGGSTEPPLRVRVYATGEGADVSDAFAYSRGI